VISQALWQLSTVEIAAAIRARRFSCSEVMVSVVERIRKLNPKLNAIVVDLTEQALAQAAAADRTTLADPGLLFGVPITIKVNIDQEGQAITNRLPALANLMAPAGSPLVRDLRSAGAIIVGRTNRPELSMGLTTINPLHGRTWNPWHPDASSGGSSGGAGVSAPFDREPGGSFKALCGGSRLPIYFVCHALPVSDGQQGLRARRASNPP
jgi:amidase